MTTDPRIEAAALEDATDVVWSRSMGEIGVCCHDRERDDYKDAEEIAKEAITAYLAAADKAATITTTEELEHLEFGTVIRDTCGDIAEKWSPVNAIRLWYSPGKLDGKANEAITLPARVIHWGTE